MPEETLFKKEDRMSNKEIAKYLKEISEKIATGKKTTFRSGNQSTTIETPTKPMFELKIERETSISNGKSDISLEIQLEWDENGQKTPELEIE